MDQLERFIRVSIQFFSSNKKLLILMDFFFFAMYDLDIYQFSEQSRLMRDFLDGFCNLSVVLGQNERMVVLENVSLVLI